MNACEYLQRSSSLFVVKIETAALLKDTNTLTAYS